jgi:hypothetical protein
MCTVSIVSLPDVLRLVVNRDEQRTRALALPPRLTSGDGVRALAPTDPASGGTWVACNELGLAIALLNVNRPDDTPLASPQSRGAIVPGLMHCRSLDHLAAVAATIDTAVYGPFRLVAVHAGDGDVMEWSPATAVTQRQSLAVPRLFTSSGLGDHHVEGPRCALFQRSVVRGETRDLLERQDRFHAHRWRARPALSVHMSRADAWTVSRTTVEIGARQCTMSYCGEPDWIVTSATLARLSEE